MMQYTLILLAIIAAPTDCEALRAEVARLHGEVMGAVRETEGLRKELEAAASQRERLEREIVKREMEIRRLKKLAAVKSAEAATAEASRMLVDYWRWWETQARRVEEMPRRQLAAIFDLIAVGLREWAANDTARKMLAEESAAHLEGRARLIRQEADAPQTMNWPKTPRGLIELMGNNRAERARAIAPLLEQRVRWRGTLTSSPRAEQIEVYCEGILVRGALPPGAPPPEARINQTVWISGIVEEIGGSHWGGVIVRLREVEVSP